MTEETDLEKCNFRNFTSHVTLTLTLSGHTAYHHASVIDLYLHTKFHQNWKKTFLWMDQPQGPLQVQGQVSQKVGKILKIRPKQI